MEDEEVEVKLDVFYAHEAFDRAHLIEDMFDGYIMTHPFIAQTPKLKEQAEKVSEALFDMYQMISNEYFERYESDDRNGDL
jgi:hypothetical protein